MRACMHVLLYVCRSYFMCACRSEVEVSDRHFRIRYSPAGHFVVVVVMSRYYTLSMRAARLATASANARVSYALWLTSARRTCTHQPAHGCSSGPTAGHGSYGFAYLRSRPPRCKCLCLAHNGRRHSHCTQFSAIRHVAHVVRLGLFTLVTAHPADPLHPLCERSRWSR